MIVRTSVSVIAARTSSAPDSRQITPMAPLSASTVLISRSRYMGLIGTTTAPSFHAATVAMMN